MSFDPNVVRIHCYDANFHNLNPNEVMSDKAKEQLTNKSGRGNLYVSPDKTHYIEIPPENTHIPDGYKKVSLGEILELAQKKINNPYTAFDNIMSEGVDLPAAANIWGVLNWSLADPENQPSKWEKITHFFGKTVYDQAFEYNTFLYHNANKHDFSLSKFFK